jgi:hypothetical protein
VLEEHAREEEHCHEGGEARYTSTKTPRTIGTTGVIYFGSARARKTAGTAKMAAVATRLMSVVARWQIRK